MDTSPWDMAIVGAGPAGSVCAYSALARSERIRVALIDREIFPRDKSCGDAIRGDAASALKELGLGAVFDGMPEIRHLRCTYPQKFGYLEKLFNLNEHTYYVIERRVFDNYLFNAAIKRGARDYTGYKLTDAEFDESGGLWNLTLKKRSGASVERWCRTLVGADGAGSRVRRLAGLELNENKHLSLGLRAYGQADGLAEGVMRVDFLESLIPGYGWTFPLLEGKVNIGVGINKDNYRRDGTGLESCLDEYVRYLWSEGVAIKNLGDIKSHPLPLASQSPPLVPSRHVALIGDAAAMIDPFTGEGIHFGIWAGRALGEIVGQCMHEREIQTGLERFAKTYVEQFGQIMESSQSLRVMLRFHKLFM